MKIKHTEDPNPNFHERRMRLPTFVDLIQDLDEKSFDWLNSYGNTTLSNTEEGQLDPHQEALSVWLAKLKKMPRWAESLLTFSTETEIQLQERYGNDLHSIRNTIYQLQIAPYCIAVGHLKALSETKYPTTTHYQIAEDVLRHKEQKEPNREEVNALAWELLDRLKIAAPLLGLESANVREVLNLPEENGMLSWDVRAARYYESLGPEGKAQAENLRNAALKIWTSYQDSFPPQHRRMFLDGRWIPLWLDESLAARSSEVWSINWEPHREAPLRFVWVLASILWKDIVKKQINHASTLPLEIGKAVFSTYGRRDTELSRNKSQLLSSGEVIATVPAMDARYFAHLNKKALGSLDMAKTIPWVVRQGWKQQGQPNDADVSIEGGLRGFAENILHLKGDSAIGRAHRVLDAGRDFQREWPGGFKTSGLWTYTYREPSRSHPAELTITTSPILRPHSQTGRSMMGSMLSPVINPPPLTGRTNEHAAQAFFANLLVLQLVEHRKELLSGGAILTQRKIEQLAEEVELPLPTLYKTLDRWTKDGDDGEAFLVIEGNPKKAARYMLADNEKYKAEREFLLEGARRSQNGTEAAKKSIETKLDHINGKHPKKHR